MNKRYFVYELNNTNGEKTIILKNITLDMCLEYCSNRNNNYYYDEMSNIDDNYSECLDIFAFNRVNNYDNLLK